MRAKIFYLEILNLITENNYYDIGDFTYNYDTKRIEYKGKEFKPKYESLQFKIAFPYLFNFTEFHDAIYFLAMSNTPEPEIELDILCQPVKDWLDKENVNQVSVLDIIKRCFNGSLKDLSQRSLEIRVGKVLKQLGWTRVRRNYGAIWLKPE